MSIQAMNRVWQHSRAKGSELLLLLAIADFAKDDGSGAWPSVETLAHKTRLSDRNVQYLVDKLVAAGELDVKQGVGRGRANVYSVIFQPPGDGANFAPIPTAAAKGENLAPFREPSAPEKVQPVAPDPSDPSIDPSGADAVGVADGSDAIQRLLTHFTAAILKTCKDTKLNRQAIAARLASGTFTEAELATAIDHFAADGFCMRENAGRGIAWFMADEQRLEHWLNMQPDAESHLPPRQRHRAQRQTQPVDYTDGEYGHLFKTASANDHPAGSLEELKRRRLAESTASPAQPTTIPNAIARMADQDRQ